jgi:hypothetical protein
MNIAGAILGGITNMLGAGLQISGLALNVARALVGTIVFLTGGFLRLGLMLTGVVLGGLTLFAGAVARAAQSAMAFAKEASLLRANTGLGYGQAQGILGRFGAFGIGGGAVNSMLGGMGQMPAFFAQKAGMFGLPGYESSDFVPKLAQAFQAAAARGPFGMATARNMMGTLGMDSPDMMRLVNLPQNKIREQLAWQGNTQSALGIGAGDVQKWAEDVPLLINRIGSFVEMVQVKFVSGLLPYIEAGLNALTNYLGQNATKINEAIRGAVSFLFTQAPVLVLQGVQTMLGGITWLVEGFSNGARFLATNAQTVLGVIDTIINALRTFSGNAVGVGGVLVAFWHDISEAATHFGGIMTGIFRGILQYAQYLPSAWLSNQLVKSATNWNPQDYGQKFTQGRDAFLGNVGKSDLAGQYGSGIQNLLNTAAGYGDSARGLLNTANDRVGEYLALAEVNRDRGGLEPYMKQLVAASQETNDILREKGVDEAMVSALYRTINQSVAGGMVRAALS